ncbi:vesicular glutamate transporter 2.2 [Ceratina calcarata]|uniref:Sialin n=1 Tax=Ceratina calcarata TaxID=156304 RepID=A0AAJ7S286_9HYME|nr:vesicular glutamate transporter 2.2 [Ceratina calcarata]XP_017880791.1 vesicular glutamate transporter 2.2 [Ceratina calcarata]XP_017880799.1 vesicular glutamate transporter 2.2 [Ceratina calcarata]XP_017880808.1 vesicular glutamate transporter 2.2 [Ceratina calcarata]XP_026669587.1 vesicular glutamate transporter 2.2 [Ceratina calcarata]XP_026669588.1 vesicular glutamate transporter 2.2 [Ceratina calcarata]XP_026669592.1 vesicular glutamate transporter 2.2 [Ceratina calcarata]
MERKKSSAEPVKDTEYGTVKYTDGLTSSWKFWQKRRYVVGVLAFLGFFTSYILRVNLSVAIVAMNAKVRKVNETGEKYFEPEFNWDSKTQGLVLSSFFYGYISTQLLGGWLGGRIGGKRVFGLGIAVTAFLTIITPPLVRVSVYILVALRIVEGICEGVTYPCIHAIWAQWAPPLERSKLATLAFSGSFFGTVFAMPVAGLMAEHLGWSSVFYVFGTVGLVWFFYWWIIVQDKPEDDKYISEAELAYIKNSLGNSKADKITHPWKKMLTSAPVWAIVAAHFSENWGFYTMLTQLPTFMNDVLDFKLDKTGYLSALPYLAMTIVVQFSGHLADYLRTKKILTTTQVRKFFNCGAFVFQTIFMTCTGLIFNPIGVVICITIAVGLGGFAWSGFGVNHLDIAPKHASVLMGIGNTIATLPGIVSPILTGYIVQNKSPWEWRVVFIISGAVYMIGAVIYGLYASGEKQPWAEEHEETNRETKRSYENPAMEVDNL